MVVKGFQQKKGVDFNKMFAPIMKMTSIRIVMSITASRDLGVKHLDANTTFLHPDLEEEIYISKWKDSSKRERRTWYAN